MCLCGIFFFFRYYSLHYGSLMQPERYVEIKKQTYKAALLYLFPSSTWLKKQRIQQLYSIITALFHFNTNFAFSVKCTVNVSMFSTIFTKQDNLKWKESTVSTKMFKSVTSSLVSHFPFFNTFFDEDYFENMRLGLLWLHRLEDQHFDSCLLKILDPQCVWMVSFLWLVGRLVQCAAAPDISVWTGWEWVDRDL